MLAKGAATYLAVPLAAAIVILAVVLLLPLPLSYLALPVIILLWTSFTFYFFRDPERGVSRGIVSPADGRVLDVKDDGEKVTIAIFMGLGDVHVNRAPLDCRVKRVERVDGAHRPAYDPASRGNEAVLWVLETQCGEVALWQITGIFARRIVPFVKVGDTLRKGERIGMICFGSRVDLELPRASVEPKVSVGDVVRAASSTIAEVRG
ncbi:MAG: phosphatidylserine decarboxylase [Candidatus Thermoplasmatota archaeon]